MQSASFNKSKRILGILLLAAVLIGSNICTYTVTNNKKTPDPSITPPGYRVVFYEPVKSDMGARRFAPRILGMEDSELQYKINDSLEAVFANWRPDKYPELAYAGATLSTSKYFSVKIVYVFTSGRTDYDYVCDTIDMSTGEVLYLDDLIEVDEELVSMILTEGTIKMDFDVYTGEHDVYYSQKGLDTERPAYVLERLQSCSVPYGEYEWGSKPTFYLEKDRLHLLEVFNEYSYFYIELDKISHKLKVDAW